MSIEIKVPTLGESVTEVTIGQWFKKVGDAVKADEPVVELETDKVTIEVPAPAGGTMEAISAAEGETVAVGALIGAIAEGAVAARPAPSTEAKPAAAEAPKPNGQTGAAKPAEAKPAQLSSGGMPPAPSAAKMLREAGIDAADVVGSGKRGPVLKEDVTRLLDQVRPAAPAGAKTVREP